MFANAGTIRGRSDLGTVPSAPGDSPGHFGMRQKSVGAAVPEIAPRTAKGTASIGFGMKGPEFGHDVIISRSPHLETSNFCLKGFALSPLPWEFM